MPDRDALLAQAEDDIAAEVQAVLDEVAADFATELDAATELVAARFSMAAIARMWSQRVPRLVRRLLGVTEAAAQHAAGTVDAELPEEWDDLPGRYDSGRLPAGLGAYVETTEHLLRAVGDRLSSAAVTELAAGLGAGEDIEALRARLRARFDREGAQLGDAREERIARTEAARAWNSATLAAGMALAGPDRPLVKQWLTRGDSTVRDAHEDVAGQLRLLNEPFTVGGVEMSGPGDPGAPPALTVNCRCVLALAHADRSTAMESKTISCVTSSNRKELAIMESLTAASGEHTGAMIALLPTPADAARLAVEGGEDVSELHLTLYYLGDGADWSDSERAELANAVRARLADIPGPLPGYAFGANHWNSNGDDPCWVWAVSDDRDANEEGPTLTTVRAAATDALQEAHGPEIPRQHSPWVPHVAAAYSPDPVLLAELESRLGPLVFDRVRLAFAGEHIDIPLGPGAVPAEQTAAAPVALLPRPWSTPGDAALAYENTETGDGRIFAPGSLTWGTGPWPLQYADEMLSGHEGAELAGAIQDVGRDGDRIAGAGVLYPGRPAGADAILLLEDEAPLGVSVDLDDVDVEFIDRRPPEEQPQDDEVLLVASLASASVLRLADGGWMVRATAAAQWTASGQAMLRTSHAAEWTTAADGTVPFKAVRAAFKDARITAAAGDPDDPERGELVHQESAGDVLMRITRARLRGATLVAMPAYDRARIVLGPEPDPEQTAACTPTVQAAGDAMTRVIRYVSGAPVAVTPREVAEALSIPLAQARSLLARAVTAGHLVRLARGLYVGSPDLPEGEVSAAMSGDLSLPVHPDRDAPWDGDAAASRVLAWATAEDGTVNGQRLGTAFLYRDDTADPATLAAYKLGTADVFDGELHIVPGAVFAIASVLQGGRGGADIPETEQDDLRERVEDLYARLADALDDPTLRAPWDDDEEETGMRELEASAWNAMSQAPPMPAAWFREPTAEELPPGSGGVHYKDGRVYGWVAQAGEPHAGYPGKSLTIESLGRIDTTHFLRAKFRLDDGSTVKAGAFTMNAGHHRDGAECETAACQFDDTRTVAGIVTVGMNARGMWFSGAAAPWLAEWDRAVFQACQPSYHMRQGRGGAWQLRAVLSVPVPGHSSPLLASAVAERSNLALVASMSVPMTSTDTSPGQPHTTSGGQAPDLPGQAPDESATSALAAALVSPPVLDRLLDALDQRAADRQAARAEIEQLTQRLAPARMDLAASFAAKVKEGI
ncbi:phage minor head protein [Streptomyces sp. NPDC088768]|uniref:phage minor head protein n=1 Tax=Streptomyces sp. NPDC088768 TaxID=3365894 RepID=UPI00382B735C